MGWGLKGQPWVPKHQSWRCSLALPLRPAGKLDCLGRPPAPLGPNMRGLLLKSLCRVSKAQIAFQELDISCQKFPWPLHRTLDPDIVCTLEPHIPTLCCEAATQKFRLDEQLTGPCEREEWAMRPDNEVKEGAGGWGPFRSPPHPPHPAQGLGEHPVRQCNHPAIFPVVREPGWIPLC